MSEDIVAAGHAYWLPLPLEESEAALTQDLRERFAETTPADALELEAAGLAMIVEELAKPLPEESDTRNLAAWALLHDPERLDTRGFATLRAVRVAAGTSEEECVSLVVEDQPLYQDPLVTRMETRSGDAISLRFRAMVEEDGETQVHQTSAVLWPRTEHHLLFVLSNYATDLVEAAGIADRLDELAAGIEGL